MNRKRRTTILIDGNPELRAQFAAQVRDHHPVSIVSEPILGLVMTRMRDTAREAQFYLGELLVTEAKVRVAGTIGIGMIAGDQAEAAVDLAVIDAAYNGRLPLRDTWRTRLEKEERRIAERRREEEARVLETRVDFQTMDVE
jgi:alpha-D-ribose 1-methylphosphonate 5-triphosphate synthase subunit PhnG